MNLPSKPEAQCCQGDRERERERERERKKER
jgi:hypothetical protein